jgi:hypothetical protein
MEIAMKLVIDTQIAENYAAHRGFEGEYRWKFKGGNTFVVDNITEAQQVRIERDGLTTLKELLEENNDYYREYIIGYRIVQDDAPEGEEWDTPFHLYYDRTRGWYAQRLIDNTTEYGYMRREITMKLESYTMGKAGERIDYYAEYKLTNGRWVCGDDALRAALQELELEAA